MIQKDSGDLLITYIAEQKTTPLNLFITTSINIAETFNDFFLNACGPQDRNLNTNEHNRYLTNSTKFSVFDPSQ